MDDTILRDMARRRTVGSDLARLDLLQALRRARDSIDRDFAQSLSLDALAQTAGYSRYHFARAFAEVYSETPREYLSRRRIERAKDLLRAANLTVTEICLEVGFDSLGSFSKRFKELVGVPPTDYRRRATYRGGPPPVPGCFVLMWTRPVSNDRNRKEASATSNT